ncbi:MAG: tetratricopeptide repeat protein, partial [Gemmatimonadales bacterium]
ELEVPDLDLSGEISEEEAPAAGTIKQPRSTGDPGFHSPQVRTLDMSAWDTPLPGAESLEILEAPVTEEPAAAEMVPAGLDALLDQVADDPDNPDLHRSLGEALLEQGERERGVEELDIALEIYQLKEDWRAAEGLAEEILRIEPNSVRHNQNLVEFAFRRGDKERLAEAYLGLADALFRTGAAERAHAVYQRVLEHDPGNERAQLGLQTLEPAVAEEPAQAAVEQTEEPAAAALGSEFVDLGALVLDDEVVARVRDTRMRIEEEEPTGDEQKDFEEMLGQFKKGIEQNLDDEDWRAHYDLGIAFKEMGLLDEAISSFQKALRSQEGRLRAAEALGLCFFEKGQFAVAATVLRRAVETDRGGDDGMIGLLYWLGRCEEQQSRVPEALTHYQRVFAIDINFLDVSDRVSQLAKAGG